MLILSLTTAIPMFSVFYKNANTDSELSEDDGQDLRDDDGIIVFDG